MAAVLTIIGYSLNDTIVIFDRIRENTAFIARKALLVGEQIDQTIVVGVRF